MLQPSNTGLSIREQKCRFDEQERTIFQQTFFQREFSPEPKLSEKDLNVPKNKRSIVSASKNCGGWFPEQKSVRSGKRTPAHIPGPEFIRLHPQVMAIPESGALDRSTILTTDVRSLSCNQSILSKQLRKEIHDVFSQQLNRTESVTTRSIDEFTFNFHT